MIPQTENLNGRKEAGAAGRIIRETASVCPVCLEPLQACVRVTGTAVYLEKSCRRHGLFKVLLSTHPEDYKLLSDCYFSLIPDVLEQREYYVCASMRCNIRCPICFLPYCQERRPLSLRDLTAVLDDKPSVERFTFSHGEPTLNPQLPEMIQILKKAGKVVNIHTNGVKLADYEYAASLKRAGMDHVSLQFDGFRDEVYEALRGEKMLEIKMRALDNLKALGIPVTLNVTVARGLNDQEWGAIFDYVVRNHFIKDVSYITYCHYSPEEKDHERAMMPDDLLSSLVEHSAGRIRRADVIAFQKLFYAYLSAFRKKKCFNYYHYFVVRTRDGYRGIGQYLDLLKIAANIDAVMSKNQIMTKKKLFQILFSGLRGKSLALIPYGLRLLLRGGYPKKPGKFLVVTLASICDPYKYDARIALNCGQGIVTQTTQHESYGTYIIDEMKLSRSPLKKEEPSC